MKKTAVPTIFCRCPGRRALQSLPLNVQQDHGYHYRPALGKENPKDLKRGRPKKSVGFVHFPTCPLKEAPSSRPQRPTVRLPDGSSAVTSVPSIEETFTENFLENEVTPSSAVTSVPSIEENLTENLLANEVTPSSEVTSVSSTEENLTENFLGNEVNPSSAVTSVSSIEENLTENFLENDVTPASPLQANPAVNLLEENEKLRRELNNTQQRLHKTTFLLNRTHNALMSVRRQKNRFKTQLTRSRDKFKNLVLHSAKRFGQDQLDALSRGGTLRGTQWSDATLMKSLRIHFACGSSGYDVVSSEQMPLPCRRVQQNRLQHLKFAAGILHEYFRLLPTKTRVMTAPQTEAMMGVDEMALKPALNPDPSTKTYIGKCTLPARFPEELENKFRHNPVLLQMEKKRFEQESLNTFATKAMTLIIGGMQVRYKVTGGFHLIGNSVCPYAVKDFIVDALQNAHDGGLLIRTLVTDMGNRAVWAALGINVGPNTATFFVQHPIRPDMKLYVMPDTPHVFKNTVEALRSNKEMTIAPHLVLKFDLPTNLVKLEHLQKLCAYQANMRWKLAPGLTNDLLNVNHFAKMRVGNATKVCNPRVAAAVRYLSHTEAGEPGMRTTAWFIEVLSKWFQKMTARTPVRALGRKNPEAFAKAVDILHLVLDLFQTLKIGKGGWKPCQTGVKQGTLCILELSKLFLDELDYQFFLPGRVTTDMNENAHSVLRYNNPIPTALQFKQRLRAMCASQFMKHVPKSSYDLDDRTELIDLLHAEGLPVPEDLPSPPEFSVDEDEDIILASLAADTEFGHVEKMPDNEKCAFYRVCGYILFKLIQEHRSSLRECFTCLSACSHSGPVPHKYAVLLKLTNFKDDSLVEVSDSVFALLVSVEELVIAVEPALEQLKTDVIQFLEQKVCIVPIPEELQLPCHPNLPQEIIHRYIQFRFKYHPGKSTNKDCKTPSAAYSSMSVGARSLADKFNPSGKKRSTKRSN